MKTRARATDATHSEIKTQMEEKETTIVLILKLGDTNLYFDLFILYQVFYFLLLIILMLTSMSISFGNQYSTLNVRNNGLFRNLWSSWFV